MGRGGLNRKWRGLCGINSGGEGGGEQKKGEAREVGVKKNAKDGMTENGGH